MAHLRGSCRGRQFVRVSVSLGLTWLRWYHCASHCTCTAPSKQSRPGHHRTQKCKWMWLCSNSCCNRWRLCECHFRSSEYLRRPCATPCSSSHSSCHCRRTPSCHSWKASQVLSSSGCWTWPCSWLLCYAPERKTTACDLLCWYRLTWVDCIPGRTLSKPDIGFHFRNEIQKAVSCPQHPSACTLDYPWSF